MKDKDILTLCQGCYKTSQAITDTYGYLQHLPKEKQKQTHNIPEERIKHNAKSCKPKIWVSPENWKISGCFSKWLNHLKEEKKKGN